MNRPLSVVSANVQGLKDAHKRLSLFTYYKGLSTADIFLLQETHCTSSTLAQTWSQDALQSGFGSLFTQGQTAILWRLSSSLLSHPPSQLNLVSQTLLAGERSTDVVFDVGPDKIHIFSVYVPSSPPAFRCSFLEDLRRAVSTSPHPLLLLGGDWNCVTDPMLDSTSPDGANTGSVQMLHMVQSLHLTDTFRKLFPHKKLFTNKASHGADRRLDRFYTSPLLANSVQNMGQWKRSGSTHTPITLKLSLPGSASYGPGKWKLGRHWLDRPGFADSAMAAIPALHQASTETHPEDPFLAWDSTKAKLALYLSSLCHTLTKWDRTWGDQNPDLLLQNKACRARLPSSLAGETSINIRLKQVRQADTFSSISTPHGPVSTPQDMLGCASNYFSNIFNAKSISDTAQEEILSHLESCLTDQDALKLEEPVSMEELAQSAWGCQTGKAPGPDGFPLEFYLKTWDVTGPILLSLINLVPERGSLSPSQCTSHIHLLHKSGAKDKMDNWRPLSLINTDARIFSQMANRRLLPLLTSLIGQSQTGFIPSRWIGTNIAEMQALMDESPSLRGLLAVVDFSKAYDRVSHTFIHSCLKAYGFQPRFQAWLTASFTNIRASVYLNGWLGSSFPVLSGVRQGDPVAPAIFTLIIEALACLIRKRIRGIQRPPLLPFLERLHADDLALGLADQQDLEVFNTCLDLYCSASGGQVNLAKSFLYPMGLQPALSMTGLAHRWRIDNNAFRYLGVMVGPSVDSTAVWKGLASQVVRRMTSIPMYDLPLASRCAIINRYCYSKVFYLDAFIPCPLSVSNSLEESALTAIWKGHHTRKVSTARLKLPLESGGFGLLPLTTQFLAARAKWIYNLLTCSDETMTHLYAIRVDLGGCLLKDKAYVKTKLNPNTFQREVSHTYQWFGPFCQAGLPVQWPEATMAMRSRLPTRWLAYLDAWEELVHLKPTLATYWDKSILSGHIRPINWKVPEAFFLDFNKKKVSLELFSATRANLLKSISSPIVPAGWVTAFPQLKHNKDWSSRWKALSSLRWKMPEQVDTAHQLSLYSLHPGHHTSSISSTFPNNTTKSCQLCLDPTSVETHEHVFTTCPASLAIWNACQESSTPRPNLQALVCPAISPSKPVLALQCLYIADVWKLLQQRRWAEQQVTILPLKDLTTRGMKLRKKWTFLKLKIKD
jgi:exonuclease III